MQSHKKYIKELLASKKTNEEYLKENQEKLKTELLNKQKTKIDKI